MHDIIFILRRGRRRRRSLRCISLRPGIIFVPSERRNVRSSPMSQTLQRWINTRASKKGRKGAAFYSAIFLVLIIASNVVVEREREAARKFIKTRCGKTLRRRSFRPGSGIGELTN